MKYYPGRVVTWAYRMVVGILVPPVRFFTDRHWSGIENIPEEGGFIAVSNHVTNFDPLTFGHFLVANGIPVKFLAKSGLFETPIVGPILSACRQIPVYRGTTRAAESLDAAEEALRSGECVGIFPEGTLTHDPDEWPMKGYPGAARLALSTGVPVIPVAQWGAQRVIPRFENYPASLRKQRVDVMAMPPVDLSRFEGKPLTHDVLLEATEVIMSELTRGVAELRGEEPPKHVWDRRVDGDRRLPHKVAKAKRKAKEKAAKQ